MRVRHSSLNRHLQCHGKRGGELIQVPGSKQSNILLWAVPTYDSLRDWSQEVSPDTIGFRNNYHPCIYSDVQYLNIFADDLETSYKLTVLPTDNNWYTIGGIMGNSFDKGDEQWTRDECRFSRLHK